MPIYHKTPPPPSTVGNHNTAEIDYHTSEAAKVKRTREQAYFNSYDFDAIEVLPYDDEGDEDEDGEGEGEGVSEVKSNHRAKERNQLKSIQIRRQQNKTTQHLPPHHSHQHKQQQPQHLKAQQTPNHTLKAVSSSCKSFLFDNLRQQHPLHHHVNSKRNPSMYLQRISSIFVSKNNNSNKTQPQQHHKQHNNAGCVSDVAVAVAVAVEALGHDNKHFKFTSSKTSSTSLSSSSLVEEILNIDNDGGVGSDVIATGSGRLPLESAARIVSGTAIRASDTTNKALACTSAATAASAALTNTAGNGGNFLLPRAILKCQSSTLNPQQGAAATTAGITNSMPLATNLSSSRNNDPANIDRKLRPQKIVLNTARDVHKLDGLKANNAMMPKAGCNTSLRLKKTSSSSSVITSLASEDIEGDRDLEENEEELGAKRKAQEKPLPKAINTKASARASSHQSHYSTDKSASSGYYSSNLCSTYSLEEHIYSEPTLDLKELRKNAKENKLSSSASVAATTTPSAATTLQTHNKLQQLGNSLLPSASEANNIMRSLDTSRRYRFTENVSQTLPSNINSPVFNENLKILESSIENLDRHLKSFPGVNPQEALVSYTQNPYIHYASVNHNDKLRSSSSYHHLPTIQESLDAVKKQSWPEDRSDDSLMDIDLDSFLLDKDKKLGGKSKVALNNKGVENPAFLTDEQEENHYKCAKYINSCPEDAYRVESDIIAPARSSISGQSLAVSVDLYPKRYEEQLHFQNTRELLEDVRDKIRLLTQAQEAESQQVAASNEEAKEAHIPKELHSMINTLKLELELYLDRMNQHSELEIRQLCTGLVKNQNIVKMKNAFERRRSLSEASDFYSTYEAVQDGIQLNAQGVPISIRQQITSIRCSSDPNFKMKRKSLTEVFPLAECYVESLQTALPNKTTTQLQRNLSYHKPVLEQQLSCTNTTADLKGNSHSSASGNASSGDTSEPNDKDSILDWHRKKPSIWEMYYGTNRIQQSLLGAKKNGMMIATATASSPSTMCYPSSRPESDFTLDLPRAEQLRIKMEKEKKFRQRCRIITTFLSLVFFLLTVMVVSLVLTRGKRMFGSMI